MDLLPKVFRTEGDMVDFDPSKILVSIMKETRMNEGDANHITELSVRRIISSGIRFLSGPHIREIVCSILSEQHFEQERKLYTRIGMPLMDYEEILEKGPKNKAVESINPEKIHHWAANQLAEEYTLLRILSDEESKAHLFGEIHIHKLKYFDLRPLSQQWDPRIILKYGLPPASSWTHCCKSGPAGDLRVAVNHLAKWLGMAQGEFSGNQGFYYITTFLAPYASRESDEMIQQAMQSLVYEINQLSAVIGRSLPITSISCSPKIMDFLSNIPAVSKYGKIKGTYIEYQDECLKLFNALTEIFRKGDYYGNAFLFPKHLVFFNEQMLKEYKDAYSMIWEELRLMKTPYLINLGSDWLDKKLRNELELEGYINSGILQNICLNLPRNAYMSNDEDAFFEILEVMIGLCSKILLKKVDIIEKRLNSKHLPICSGLIEEQNIFDLNKQALSISFAGLNEAVKFLTNFELHENPDAFSLGRKIIMAMNEICNKLTERDNKKYILIEDPSKKANYRFPKLDLRHFPKLTIPQSIGGEPYYTNSAHFRSNIAINLLNKIDQQGEFQSLIQNGVIEQIYLSEIEKNNLELEDFIKNISINSKIACLKFNP